MKFVFFGTPEFAAIIMEKKTMAAMFRTRYRKTKSRIIRMTFRALFIILKKAVFYNRLSVFHRKAR